MPVKTYTWISLWFLATAPIIAWDIGYCFMRPRSMEVQNTFKIARPYAIYQKVDLLYGVDAYNRGEGFVNAQALLNTFETFLNLAYLYLAHFAAWPTAPLVGFTAAALTLAKTILYLSQEYYCNYCATGHNTTKDMLMYYYPNLLWLLFPSLIILRLGKDLAQALNTVDSIDLKDTLGKKA
ncbi:hypothetical protein C8J57DRAFT_1717650 [Mycena rebaudengoi]|nr:hypothetical protein C8J57DRAFT_1717650 [Mycena rebaudengoi]